jgi:hypothetical protein
MKHKSTVLMAILALATLFTIGTAKEAKAAQPDNIGFSFDVVMADGGQIVNGVGHCNLYNKEGKLIGTISADGGNTLTFTTNQGTLVVEDTNSIALPTEDGTMALGAGELTVVSATGAYQGVTSVMHRCLYEIDANGHPTKCINCLYAFLRE